MHKAGPTRRKWKVIEICLLLVVLNIMNSSVNPLSVSSLFKKIQSSDNVGSVELIAEEQFILKVGSCYTLGLWPDGCNGWHNLCVRVCFCVLPLPLPNGQGQVCRSRSQVKSQVTMWKTFVVVISIACLTALRLRDVADKEGILGIHSTPKETIHFVFGWVLKM